MRASPKPKKRNAWLITWESSRDDYLRDRPRVVAILKPQISSETIKTILPVLFTSEYQLTFSEKISYSFSRRGPNWLRREDGAISCGGNPWLRARAVYDLYVQTYGNTYYRQTLHWTEPRYSIDPKTNRPVEVFPAQRNSEDVHFDVLWYRKSFLDENE
jgi:hypothetical protein